MRYSPAESPLVLQLKWYWVPSQSKAEPTVGSTLGTASLTVAPSQDPRFALRVNVGSDVWLTTLPAASSNLNFAGIVWPSRNRLSTSPDWCPVSLMGWRNPLHA